MSPSSGLLLIALLPFAVCAAVHPALTAAMGRDTTCTVWVIFSDKGAASRNGPALSTTALKRRQMARYPAESPEDQPVSSAYLDRVRASGASLRNTFSWANAASFTLAGRDITRVAALPFVRHVIPVTSYRREALLPAAFLGKAARVGQPLAALYGESYHQLAMLDVPLAQEYLQRYRSQAPGAGVIVGMFDTGFWLGHAAFGRVRATGAVLADSDFVAHDGDPYFSYLTHGASTMAFIGGYDPARLMGVAWDARFVLARTEDDLSEHHVEEDNWAAALVWAEGLGVSIVNSSLGYRYDFTAPDSSYSYQDMDGRTTIVARATEGALARGIIIVSSMGNDGGLGAGSINSPADSRDVVSVGAVDADEEIAGFSSRGPTSDGRTKPDCVAMGVSAVTLGPLEDSYQVGSGTSYSAPLTAGVAALLRQAWPDSSAAAIVDRLYRSCRFAKHQTAVDNTYGRGIPDALLGCMRPGELLVLALDSSGRRLDNVVLSDSTGRSLGATDSSGTALVGLAAGARSVRVTVTADLRGSRTVVVDSLPACRTLVFGALPEARFDVFPNVVRLRDATQGLTVRFVDEGNRTARAYAISVRGVNGELLWHTGGTTSPHDPLRVHYGCVNESGRSLVPGTYFLLFELDGERQIRKFLVVP
jgi:hypothetical protein